MFWDVYLAILAAAATIAVLAAIIANNSRL